MTTTSSLLTAVLVLTATACRERDASPLLSPSAEDLAKPAPDSFSVAFETSKGPFVVRAVRAWAPYGVDRFYFLASNHYYDGAKFFRVLPNFIVQFGIHGDPAVNDVWRERSIPDDSVRQSNQAGYLTYAMGGPNSRTTQLFINTRDNRRLDAMGFAPIGRVTDGMHVVELFLGAYGEEPSQDRIQSQGNAYLERWFPRLDSIARTQILKD